MTSCFVYRLTRVKQGPFDRGSVYAPPTRTSAHVAHIDDEAAYFEDAVLNPALELDPDATIEGFKAAISAEVSARIAASKSAVKAEATQLYKANVVGSNLAWRKSDSYHTNSAYTDTGFTHEPITEFTVGGSGRSGRGQKQPAFGAAEGHYDPSGRASRRASERTRTVSVEHAHAHEQHAHVARGGDHGHTDRRFVKGKWAPPRTPIRAKSAPPTRPSGPNLHTDRHRRGNTPKANPSMSGHFSDGEGADEGADAITDTVRKASATRRAAANALAKRREERMDRAAKTRAALELQRNAEVEAALAEAEAKRAHAAEEAKRRKAPVAFGGRTDKLPPKAAADEDKKLPRDKDGKLIPRPFKLSETKPRHRAGIFDDDDENKAPARDPDVWESPEEEEARLEREKIEKAAANQKRRELAEKAHKYGTQTATKPTKENRIGADPKRRSLQDTFAEAHHRRDLEIEHNAERRRSRETLRQSAVVAAAAQVAAPAIAAAEAAQRNASAAASAAAKAAQAAAAAEALMMNEAQRLREQRKRLFSREAGREGGRHPISVGASFNSRFDASADDDDAVPLMASLEGDELHTGSLLYRTERVAATAAAAAQAAAKEADFPVPSKSPAPTTDGDGITTDFDAPQVRVSSSLATPSPIKVPGTSPSPLREAVTSRLGGAEIKEAARDVNEVSNKNGTEDEVVVRDGGSMFESVEEDANALAAALPPLESADKVAKTSRRVAERRKRNDKTSGAAPGGRVLAESVVTPPSPRSPAVAWRVGARELPGPLRQPVFASSKAVPEALTVDQPLKNASSKDDESRHKGTHQSVAAKKAAEARANAMAELASVQLPNDTSTSSHDVSTVSVADDKSPDGESRAPAAPKFLRGGDLYDYVGPQRIMTASASIQSSAFDPESSGDDDESDDETWLRRGSADSSEFERTTAMNTTAGTTNSDKADLSLTRSATAAIAREMHHGHTRDVSEFYVRHSHPEGRAALAAALAREDAEISDVESVESLE